MTTQTYRFNDNDFLRSVSDVVFALKSGKTVIGCDFQNGVYIAEMIYALDDNSSILEKNILYQYSPVECSLELNFEVAHETADVTLDAQNIFESHKHVIVDGVGCLDIETPIKRINLTKELIRALIKQPKTMTIIKKTNE